MQPLKNTASVTLMDSQTLSIKAWDKTVLHSIAKAITDSGLGLNPQSMADSIMIKVPALTEERRKEIAKIAKKNNIAIGINQDELINSDSRKKSQILARIRQNIELCKKNKLKKRLKNEPKHIPNRENISGG